MAKRTSKKKDVAHLPEWSTGHAKELYGIRRWGAGYFGINEKGNVCVTTRGKEGKKLDLFGFVNELRERDIQLPVLIRFTDILQSRIHDLHKCFSDVIEEYDAIVHEIEPLTPPEEGHWLALIEVLIKEKQ